MTRDSRVLSLCSSPAWCCAAAGTADGGPGSCSRRASTVRDLGGFGGSLPRPRRRCVPALGALCEVGGCVCFCGGQQGTDACRPLLQFLQLIVDNLGRISKTVVFLDYSRARNVGFKIRIAAPRQHLVAFYGTNEYCIFTVSQSSRVRTCRSRSWT